MKARIQQMVGRFKTANLKAQKRAIPVEHSSAATPASRKTQASTDEWDMSPQDALQVGIVARHK